LGGLKKGGFLAHRSLSRSEDQAEAEGRIIGRLLAGYGELELEMCACLAAVTNNLDGAIKTLFRGRGGENRITAADTLMKQQFIDAGLAAPYQAALCDMDWCRQIRNQYAHCHWYYTPREGLCFINLEKSAKKSDPIFNVTYGRIPLDGKLLTKQEAYFKYVQKCFWSLQSAYRTWAGRPSSPDWPLPPKLNRPQKHKGTA
jgi:hypothetical protein